MNLIMENWRKFINEDFRKGGMGSEPSDAKNDIISQLSGALSRAQKSSANQFASVILGEKPMYYGIVGADGIDIEDKTLQDMIRSKGLALEVTPHTEMAKPNVKAYYFGKVENVKAAVMLSKNPLIGKEEYDYEDSFWKWVHPRFIKVTPEWNRRLGVLLGYGESNAKEFARRRDEKLADFYEVWNDYKGELT